MLLFPFINIWIYKKFILFSIDFVLSVMAFCQTNLMDYAGGIKEFHRLLAKNLRVTGKMDKKDINRTFDVSMNINTKGLIDRVEITSFGDSTGANMILGEIELSRSNWINPSGQDQYYMNRKSKSVIQFGTVTVRIYPTQF
jgi:hypothetical protein